MKKIIIAVSLLCIAGTAAQAQKKTDKKTESSASGEGFTKLPSGLYYKKIKDANTGNSPKVGDYVEVNILTKIDKTSVGDSVIFDTRDMDHGKPVPFQIQKSNFNGDLVEGLQLMTAGDSFVFKLVVDSLLKAGAAPSVPWMRKGEGQMLYYYTTLASVKSSADVEKERQENASKQVAIDEKLLQDYFAKNNIKASKTASGLYYKVDVEGKGQKANIGDTVVVNYTGMTMDGKKFDSNVDPAFMHTEPFIFSVGIGQVIRGWDEGFQIFKKGSKGTLYIPSYLAYADRSPDPARIPNNAILVFDIEMVDVKATKKN
jgi:FKBP-type peptidyl-prolyl cis-trans isomerase FkpA